jgi:hypothetical protein
MTNHQLGDREFGLTPVRVGDGCQTKGVMSCGSNSEDGGCTCWLREEGGPVTNREESLVEHMALKERVKE